MKQFNENILAIDVLLAELQLADRIYVKNLPQVSDEILAKRCKSQNRNSSSAMEIDDQDLPKPQIE